MSQPIEARGLEKTFVKRRPVREALLRPFAPTERVQALRGVDLDVRAGEIFGLLGPNGAGKTTLLKILCCLVLPDRGTASIGGAPIEDEQTVKRRIGLVHSDERSFYWRLSARENLRFFARIYDVPPESTEARIEELLRRVDMLQAADRPLGGYSSGMKQRIAIARALLHRPPVLLMDEPTRSLDPSSSLAIREFIDRELRRRDGATILLASHNLPEVAALADRVAIIARGRVLRRGTVDEVRRWEISGERYDLELGPSDAPLPAGPFRVEGDERSAAVRRARIALEPGATLGEALGALLSAGVEIRRSDRHEPDLEEAFSRALADDEGAA